MLRWNFVVVLWEYRGGVRGLIWYLGKFFEGNVWVVFWRESYLGKERWVLSRGVV